MSRVEIMATEKHDLRARSSVGLLCIALLISAIMPWTREIARRVDWSSRSYLGSIEQYFIAKQSYMVGGSLEHVSIFDPSVQVKVFCPHLNSRYGADRNPYGHSQFERLRGVKPDVSLAVATNYVTVPVSIGIPKVSGYRAVKQRGIDVVVGLFTLCRTAIPDLASELKLRELLRVLTYGYRCNLKSIHVKKGSLDGLCPLARDAVLLDHLIQLQVIYANGTYRQDGEYDGQVKSRMIDPVNSGRRLLAILFLVIGILCALVAHYALLWKAGSWMLIKRLGFGIPGWGIASVFLWHGFTLLLGP